MVLHAARRAHISAGQTVLVLGAGAVGLLACTVAAAHGATTLIVVDMFVVLAPIHFACGGTLILPLAATVMAIESTLLSRKVSRPRVTLFPEHLDPSHQPRAWKLPKSWRTGSSRSTAQQTDSTSSSNVPEWRLVCKLLSTVRDLVGRWSSLAWEHQMLLSPFQPPLSVRSTSWESSAMREPFSFHDILKVNQLIDPLT